MAIIAIDFDGTCVTHEYPNIGKDTGAVPVLKKLVENKHQLLLWTMRSGDTLRDAVRWFEYYEINLYGVNTNPTQKSWTESPKAYAQLYIDDAALGCPLITKTYDNSVILERGYVDWIKVEELLKQMNYIK